MTGRPARLEGHHRARSAQRSESILLRLSPELLARIDAAASAAKRPRLPFLLAILDREIPELLDLGDHAKETSVAS